MNTGFSFTEGAATKDFETTLHTEMEKPVKFYEKELTKFRTGRAHTSMVEDIKVESYGTMTPLKQVAALSAPDVNLIVIQPWDKTILPEVEKAIQLSDMGVTPMNDGDVIRLTLPKLSNERRMEFVKTLAKKAEDARIAVRAVRKDYHNLVRDAQKDKKISEDYAKRLNDSLQKVTDSAIKTIDQFTQKKEQELKSV